MPRLIFGAFLLACRISEPFVCSQSCQGVPHGDCPAVLPTMEKIRIFLATRSASSGKLLDPSLQHDASDREYTFPTFFEADEA